MWRSLLLGMRKLEKNSGEYDIYLDLIILQLIYSEKCHIIRTQVRESVSFLLCAIIARGNHYDDGSYEWSGNNR